MKQGKRIVSFFLVVILLLMSGCSNQSIEPVQSVDGPTFNIVFALATVPPVMAALECFDNGYETYAIIERGKTYNGIDGIEGFYNAGFDPANNLSTGFTSTEFWSMVLKVKELNENHEGAYFNFHVQDGTALMGAAIAANAGLSVNQFHVYMYEDGIGAYNALKNEYVIGKKVDNSTDEIYDHYVEMVEEAQADYETIISRSDNLIEDDTLRYNIGKAFALASLDNFTYCIQDESAILEILKNCDEESKLLTCFGVEGYAADVDYKLNLRYQRISDGVHKLSAADREAYLSLMYGQYYQDTYSTLTRLERNDSSAPAKKLVFIGSRHGNYPKFASNDEYGIGGLDNDSVIPESYSALDPKYKTELLFSTEDDYVSFLAVLNDESNYVSDLPETVKHQIQISTFNIYIDYMYTLKLTYSLYGDRYDLIMKGHPREAIGCHEEWGGSYTITVGENEVYNYDKLVDKTLLSFHAIDSTGKYIGMVPYGTSAENLAYLGADLSICGLPSSTYSGYDTGVDVLFIMAETNQDILGSGEENVASQVAARYSAGNLTFTDTSGEVVPTVFLNTGNVYKAVAEIYSSSGNEIMRDVYTTLFDKWLEQNFENAVNIDLQGFPVTE